MRTKERWDMRCSKSLAFHSLVFSILLLIVGLMPAMARGLSTVDIALFPGSVENLSLDVRGGEQVKAAFLFVKPIEFSRRVFRHSKFRKMRLLKAEIQGVSENSVVVAIEASAETPTGAYQGVLILRTGFSRRFRGGNRLRPIRKVQPRRFRIVINVEERQSGEIPEGPLTPSEDRIVKTEAGIELVKDELIVMLALATPNPDTVIRRIAQETGGMILGSTPAKTYQLGFAVNTQEELDVIREDIGVNNFEVVGVVPNLVFRSFLAAHGKPTEEHRPGKYPFFSNTTDWFDHINARGAWALTETIMPKHSVAVHVIDCDFDVTHEDLNDNVSVGPGAGTIGCGGHGTQVAGVIGAEWNGIGIAGMAQDHANLTLFDNTGGTKSLLMNVKDTVERAIVASPNDITAVINMSLDHFDGYTTTGARNASTMCDTVFKHSISFRDTGKKILFVAAAGNKSRNAKYSCPGRLAKSFNNFITVAASNSCPGTTCTLRSDSNKGNFVTVAAPGTNILATNNGGAYKRVKQTSFATAIVSGLAALTLAIDPSRTPEQVKFCIKSNATKTVTNQPFKLIDAEEAVLCTLPLPDKLDLVFGLDLSASMRGEINAIKGEINNILTKIKSEINDVQFGVISYEDYAGNFDSTACGSSYIETYGFSNTKTNPDGDAPFRMDLALTSNSNDVTDTISNLVIGAGGDGPQSFGRAFWEVAQSAMGNDPLAEPLGFRPNSTKVLINFGDDVPHDTNLNDDIVPPPITQAPVGGFDTGVDPGRNAMIDCNGDDIDFQDDALEDMKSAEVHLIHINSSGDDNLKTYWENWTQRTGGNTRQINTDGTLPVGETGLADFLIEQLGLIEQLRLSEANH